MRQEIRQSTTNGQATINRADGTAVYFSNGGVDGEFEIIITDQETIPALFEKVGEFDGDYSIKGLKLGAAPRSSSFPESTLCMVILPMAM